MAFGGHRQLERPDGSTASSWQSFTCGFCGRDATGAVVAIYRWTDNLGRAREVHWLACPACEHGSVMNGSRVDPGMRFGPSLEGLPPNVAAAYQEARECMSVAAYTSAELVCRKLLMHVGVDKGAKAGESFAHYVDHLASSGYVTPPMKPWVDLIRKHGNESTHELPAADKDRAEGTVMFTAELLRLVYEMDHMTKKYAAPNAAITKS